VTGTWIGTRTRHARSMSNWFVSVYVVDRDFSTKIEGLVQSHHNFIDKANLGNI